MSVAGTEQAGFHGRNAAQLSLTLGKFVHEEGLGGAVRLWPFVCSADKL